MTNSNIENRGGCYCGTVRFTFDGELPEVVYCHCSQCRRLSGHYVAAASGVQGELNVKGDVTWFESSPGFQRGFCQKCGTPLFWRDLARDYLSIMAGAFDHQTALVAKDHIYVADKANYYPICDGLPQYQAARK